jgi:DNA-binding NarL/FixJ family response regulator
MLVFGLISVVMNLINIAIIEGSPLGGSAIETILTEANFNIVINTNTANHFLNKAKEKSIDDPDICLLDRTMDASTIRKIRQHYPKIKIVVYDTIVNPPDTKVLDHNSFDAYIPNNVKLKHWPTTLQTLINRTHLKEG